MIIWYYANVIYSQQQRTFFQQKISSIVFLGEVLEVIIFKRTLTNSSKLCTLYTMGVYCWSSVGRVLCRIKLLPVTSHMF